MVTQMFCKCNMQNMWSTLTIVHVVVNLVLLDMETETGFQLLGMSPSACRSLLSGHVMMLFYLYFSGGGGMIFDPRRNPGMRVPPSGVGPLGPYPPGCERSVCRLVH